MQEEIEGLKKLVESKNLAIKELMKVDVGRLTLENLVKSALEVGSISYSRAGMLLGLSYPELNKLKWNYCVYPEVLQFVKSIRDTDFLVPSVTKESLDSWLKNKSSEILGKFSNEDLPIGSGNG